MKKKESNPVCQQVIMFSYSVLLENNWAAVDLWPRLPATCSCSQKEATAGQSGVPFLLCESDLI